MLKAKQKRRGDEVALSFSQRYNVDPKVYWEIRELYYWYGWTPNRIHRYITKTYNVKINKKTLGYWLRIKIL